MIYGYPKLHNCSISINLFIDIQNNWEIWISIIQIVSLIHAWLLLGHSFSWRRSLLFFCFWREYCYLHVNVDTDQPTAFSCQITIQNFPNKTTLSSNFNADLNINILLLMTIKSHDCLYPKIHDHELWISKIWFTDNNKSSYGYL